METASDGEHLADPVDDGGGAENSGDADYGAYDEAPGDFADGSGDGEADDDEGGDRGADGLGEGD